MTLRVLLGFLFCVMVYVDGQAQEKKLGAGSSQPPVEDDTDMYMEPVEKDHEAAPTNNEEAAESGHWFPTFSRSYEPYDHPPSGHSRPVLYNSFHQQEGAYSQRNDPPFNQDVNYNDPKFNSYNPFAKEYQQDAVQQPQTEKSASLLGDGNFGVITGGTFYPEKSGYDSDSSGFDDFSSYFHNGHGRPSSYFSYSSNPKQGKYQQFENFRDFADINNPPERQYSQYVVVYTNKNGTRISASPNATSQPENTYNGESEKIIKPSEYKTERVQVDAKRPRNILESLALLDKAGASSSDNKNSEHDDLVILTRTLLLPSYDQGDVIDISPEKKLSKSKRKLAKLVPEKKHEARLIQKAKEMKEPMLALS